jgi:ABC-type dipeptide/oligopeptide/nickel transport system ATPase component/ABC-type dipeptide/oligopeptide/nickel transport system permease subunit
MTQHEKNDVILPQNLVLRVIKSPLGAIATFALTSMVLFGIFAPIFSKFDPYVSDLMHGLENPSSVHLMGTDALGRDILVRLAIATRISILAAFIAVTIAVLLGVFMGLVAGYFGGRFEHTISWVVTLMMALPGIVVLLFAAAVLGPSLWSTMVVLGILMSPGFFRLTFTAVRGIKEELFIDAAKLFGLSSTRIIARHILRIIRGPIVIQAGIMISVSIGALGGLQFLGLTDPLVPNWGSMLNEAFTRIFTNPILIVWPTGAMALSSLSFVFLAIAIRDKLTVNSTLKRSTQEAEVTERYTHKEDAEFHRAQNQVLEIKDLVVGFKTKDGGHSIVVNKISLNVPRGAVVGLIGESGSGKTQTARSILGLLASGGEVISGSILFNSKNLLTLGRKELLALRGNEIGYIPQEPMTNLDPTLTVEKQLVEILRVKKGVKKGEALEIITKLFKDVGFRDIERVLSSYPFELSGGMAQRVLIAATLSLDPEFIIADEPTTALDVTIQAEILDLLHELTTQRNISLLLVTHNLGVVADLCDYTYVMQNGRIVEEGTVRSVYKSPNSQHAQELIGALLDETPARAPYNVNGVSHG